MHCAVRNREAKAVQVGHRGRIPVPIGRDRRPRLDRRRSARHQVVAGRLDPRGRQVERGIEAHRLSAGERHRVVAYVKPAVRLPNSSCAGRSPRCSVSGAVADRPRLWAARRGETLDRKIARRVECERCQRRSADADRPRHRGALSCAIDASPSCLDDDGRSLNPRGERHESDDEHDERARETCHVHATGVVTAWYALDLRPIPERLDLRLIWYHRPMRTLPLRIAGATVVVTGISALAIAAPGSLHRAPSASTS